MVGTNCRGTGNCITGCKNGTWLHYICKGLGTIIMNDLHSIFKAAQNGNLSFFQEHLNEKSFKETVFTCSYAKSGDTVLHYAVRHGHIDLVKFLVDEGFKIDIGNFDGKRPLHEAAHYGQVTCLKYLLSHDVNVDALKRADWYL